MLTPLIRRLPTAATFVTLDAARAIYRDLAPIAEDHGFILAIFGSVLRDGAGNDLDLLACGGPSSSSADSLIAALSAGGLELVSMDGRQGGASSWHLRESRQSSGAAIHLQIRKF